MDKQTTDCLQKDLALHMYGEESLKACISTICQIYVGDICSCTACFLTNRMTYTPSKQNSDRLQHCDDCIIKKHLIRQAENIGLQIQQCSDDQFNNLDIQLQYYNCHICIVTYHGNWVPLYGSMLGANALYLNPDLWMLKELFRICQNIEFFWE
jgi:hypothetical protein